MKSIGWMFGLASAVYDYLIISFKNGYGMGYNAWLDWMKVGGE